LQELVLRDNFSLGWGADSGEAALGPLRGCTALTHLQMERCGLRQLPQLLEDLTLLEVHWGGQFGGPLLAQGFVCTRSARRC
jgi:hypothetical protein